MTQTEALKLALEALLHAYHEDEAHPKTLDAITAIKEALALSESSTKCEETSHAQPKQELSGLPMVISGAIYDFAGYLTTRDKVIEVGSTANASPIADLVKAWAELRGLSLDDAAVLSWQEWLANVPASDTSKERVDETAKNRHEQEPEWYHGVDVHGCNRFYHKTEVRPSEFSTPLYTTPPQRKPLTDEEIPEGVLLAIQRAGLTLVMTAHGYHLMNLGLIEAAHGIKGEA